MHAAPKPTRRPPGMSAFSTTELLVALGICAALFILSSLAFRELRTSAAAIQTTASLRTLLAGSLRFAQEHKGYYPVTTWPFKGYPNPWNPSDTVPSTSWFRYLHPYIYPDAPNRNGSPLYDGTFRARYFRGYKVYGNGWEPGTWDAIDYAPVYKWSRNTKKPLEFINLYRAEKLAVIPFLLTGYNAGGAGIRDEAKFHEYCYDSRMDRRYPPAEGALPKGTAWVYDDSILVGYADGHVEKVKFQAGKNMFAKIFNQDSSP
ncbi:MAG TPA: hypothetical protein VNQ90_13630 [Chthoniobacteraceae bacterium]|nr:hypothetical protein [Chthoniobacteraceae bacterium]